MSTDALAIMTRVVEDLQQSGETALNQLRERGKAWSRERFSLAAVAAQLDMVRFI